MGQFERGAFQVIDEDFQIVRLNEKRAPECCRKNSPEWRNDELIERRRGGYEHGTRASAAAAGTAGALPGGGDGAGVSGHHNGVERADVNAEFKCTGGNTPRIFPSRKPRSISRALIWQVSRRDTREWFPAFPATAD